MWHGSYSRVIGQLVLLAFSNTSISVNLLHSWPSFLCLIANGGSLWVALPSVTGQSWYQQNKDHAPGLDDDLPWLGLHGAEMCHDSSASGSSLLLSSRLLHHPPIPTSSQFPNVCWQPAVSMLDITGKRRDVLSWEPRRPKAEKEDSSECVGCSDICPRKSGLGSAEHLCWPEWREYNFQPIKPRGKLGECSKGRK